jgi:hypothetical protein
MARPDNAATQPKKIVNFFLKNRHKTSEESFLFLRAQQAWRK